MRIESSARDYARQVRGVIATNSTDIAVRFYDWLLENGQQFDRVDWAASKKWRTEIDAQPRSCFWNTAVAAKRGLRYFEGFAMSAIPVHHAWAVDSDGVVIELTWDQYMDQLDDAPERPEDYFGVEIPVDFVIAQCFERKYAGDCMFSYFELQLHEGGKE